MQDNYNIFEENVGSLGNYNKEVNFTIDLKRDCNKLKAVNWNGMPAVIRET